MTHKGLHILQIQAILCSPLLPHSLPFPTQLPPGQAWTSQNPMPVHLSISLSEIPSLPLPWLRNFILQELIQKSPSRKPNPLRHNSLCSSLGSPLLSLPNLQYPLVPVWGLHDQCLPWTFLYVNSPLGYSCLRLNYLDIVGMFPRTYLRTPIQQLHQSLVLHVC